MRFVLFFVGLLAGNAARVDLGTKDKERAEEVHQNEHRVLDLPLIVSDSHSDPEKNHLRDLPSPWDRQLKPVGWLGQGKYGEVFKSQVLCARQDRYVSVSYIRKVRKRQEEGIKMLENLKGLSDFCITPIGSPSYLETLGYWIMMPFMNAGSLLDFTAQCERHGRCGSCWFQKGRRCWSALNPAFTEGFILALFHDIVSGVYALHKQKMIHMDLQPQNVMLNCEGAHCFAAVMSVGLVCDERHSDACDPHWTMPGGFKLVEEPSVEANVWDLGVILYRMLYQETPAFLSQDYDGNYYDPKEDRNIPHQRTKADELVVQMLSFWSDRPTLPQIMQSVKDIIVKLGDMPAYKMIRANPIERHAASEIPTCLERKSEDA